MVISEERIGEAAAGPGAPNRSSQTIPKSRYIIKNTRSKGRGGKRGGNSGRGDTELQEKTGNANGAARRFDLLEAQNASIY